MPENPNEGNQPDGTQAANPAASSATGQLLPVDLKALEQRLESLESQNKALQSDKDRRIPKLEEQIKSLAKSLGVTDPEAVAKAQRDYVLDEVVRERLAPVSDSGKPVQTPRVEVTAIASQFGLSLNDPQVIAALQPEMSELQATIALGKVALAKAKTPSPNPAQLPSTPADTTPPPPVNVNELVGKYKAEMLKNRGNKSTMLAIKEKYRALGTPVDNVDFTS
jgi:hypothetical protein